MMLAWTIYLSFAGALLEALLPKSKPALARVVGLLVALGGLVLAVAGFAALAGQGRVVITDVPWVPLMGIRFTLAADGISLVLVLLTGLASVAGERKAPSANQYAPWRLPSAHCLQKPGPIPL